MDKLWDPRIVRMPDLLSEQVCTVDPTRITWRIERNVDLGQWVLQVEMVS
jgi:hypothetical protein